MAKTSFFFLGLQFLCMFRETNAVNVVILSVHVGANPLYGYYAAAPVFKVAVAHIRRRFPESLGNMTHIAIYLAGYDLCPAGGDHTAEFFTDYYFKNMARLNAVGNYLVLASPGKYNVDYLKMKIRKHI
jgi:hypothetical protein